MAYHYDYHHDQHKAHPQNIPVGMNERGDRKPGKEQRGRAEARAVQRKVRVSQVGRASTPVPEFKMPPLGCSMTIS